MIDHHARAERLRDLMENLARVDEASFETHPDRVVDLDGEIPNVPYRFAVSEWDGNSNAINFADTLEDAAAIAADLGGGECPWSPGTMVDLDTGNTYEPVVTVSYQPIQWKVTYSWTRSADHVSEYRFASKEHAQEWIDIQRDNPDLTVHDDEPVFAWEEESANVA
jgi:hypothetical protein